MDFAQTSLHGRIANLWLAYSEVKKTQKCSSKQNTTFLSCGCCKSTNKSASCIYPLFVSCYDQMSQLHTNPFTSVPHSRMPRCSVSSFICKGNIKVACHLCVGSSGQQRSGRKRSSQRYYFHRGCSEVLQHFAALPPQPKLQFLCIMFTLTTTCFYRLLSLGKVSAVSLRLVITNATAYLPPN